MVYRYYYYYDTELDFITERRIEAETEEGIEMEIVDQLDEYSCSPGIVVACCQGVLEDNPDFANE